jgi:hypothetical protein
VHGSRVLALGQDDVLKVGGGPGADLLKDHKSSEPRLQPAAA